MDEQVEFDINESLKLYLSDSATISTPEANTALLDCENDPDNLTSAAVDDALEPIIDTITENPEGLSRSSVFDTLQFLLKYVRSYLDLLQESVISLDPLLTDLAYPGNRPFYLLNLLAKSSI